MLRAFATWRTMLDLFAVTVPGLEPLVHRELSALRCAPQAPVPGGVPFTGGPEVLARACLGLRGATRVLVRVGEGPARSLHELRRRAGELPWERFLTRGARVDVRATCKKSRVYHSGAAQERVEQALASHLGPPRNDGPPVEVLVRLDHDRATFSIDASGEPLHHRGYRLETTRAPLRETLAFAVLAHAGWDGASPLLDPLCGSGTIAIEAALLAMRRPPGASRAFAFERWPGFDPQALAVARGDLLAAALPAPPAPLFASDRDAGAIVVARRNAERAAVLEHVAIEQRSLSDARAAGERGLLACNPPYGGRISSGRDLRDLYAALGRLVRERLSGWRAAVLTPDPRLCSSTGLRVVGEGPTFSNGGINVRVILLEVG
jgi:putative N6-adenine-specific DNA methylase